MEVNNMPEHELQLRIPCQGPGSGDGDSAEPMPLPPHPETPEFKRGVIYSQSNAAK
mgnify:CR=1 FL=1